MPLLEGCWPATLTRQAYPAKAVDWGLPFLAHGAVHSPHCFSKICTSKSLGIHWAVKYPELFLTEAHPIIQCQAMENSRQTYMACSPVKG